MIDNAEIISAIIRIISIRSNKILSIGSTSDYLFVMTFERDNIYYSINVRNWFNELQVELNTDINSDNVDTIVFDIDALKIFVDSNFKIII